MTLNGSLLVAGKEERGSNSEFHATEAATGQALPVSFGGASPNQVDAAAMQAWEAFASYRETDLESRAAFLEKIAAEIEAIGDELIVRAMSETGLPRGRLEGERNRTTGQLRLFAREVRAGRFGNSASTLRILLERPFLSPTCGFATFRSDLWQSSARPISHSLFPLLVGTLRRRSPLAALSSSRRTRPIRAHRNWWGAPPSGLSPPAVFIPAPFRCSSTQASRSVRGSSPITEFAPWALPDHVAAARR